MQALLDSIGDGNHSRKNEAEEPPTTIVSSLRAYRLQLCGFFPAIQALFQIFAILPVTTSTNYQRTVLQHLKLFVSSLLELFRFPMQPQV